jgi:hypothetical protein
MDQRIIELLNGGDWACAYRESDSLARVCTGLADFLDEELAESAREIVEWTERDMKIATRRWGEFAMRVRHPAGEASGEASGRRRHQRAHWLTAVLP